ncbi:MAG: DUF2155 domain-containing protein [Pseudomonadota bacterium]
MNLQNKIFPLIAFTTLFAFCAASVAAAQDESLDDAVFSLQEELMAEPETPEEREMEGYDTVKIRALDKITARTETVDLRIGDMIDFGALTITAKACRKSLPINQPESAAFLQIWEFPLGNFEKDDIEEAQIKFSGWMFASSPGLSAMDHPIYDIWVLDCIGQTIDAAEIELQTQEIGTPATSPRDSLPDNNLSDIQTEVLSE